ncbi:atrophin-1-like isoform X1 [Rhipicephalus sanguineus]|uniref:atrophin-1-like isoform X1 n=1 Tax=Rhipicephalus sanguineus TaxID=34632 RepID=UPI0020C490E8|nr:atrophin-1-like isoform X1 [Rhipicephalus sanguineus]
MGTSWYHALIATATFCILAVNGQEYFGGRQCGCLEVPVNGPPRTENFCRWRVTPSSLLYKKWDCVCRPGMVRNAWGDCITNQECKRCKCFWYKDFNVCRRECPLKCGEPVRTTCSQDCAFGCDCPPGRIRTASKSYCVKTSKCTPICPANSHYTSCLSNCAPKCGKRQPPNCITRCRRAGCACIEGYAEAEQGGVLICVPQQECYRYASTVAPSPPPEIGSGGSSGGSTGTSGQPSPPTIRVPPPAATPTPPPEIRIVGGSGGSFSTSGQPSPPTIPVPPPAVRPSPPPETSSVGGSWGSIGTFGAHTPPAVPVPGQPRAPTNLPPPREHPVSPSNAEGTFPSGRPSHEIIGHGNGGGIAGIPPLKPHHGTPSSLPGGHWSIPPGLMFPQNTLGTPSRVPIANQTGGVPSFPQNLPSQFPTPYQPSGSVASPFEVRASGSSAPCMPCSRFTYTTSEGRPCRPCKHASATSGVLYP